jgi:hypothetical protein
MPLSALVERDGARAVERGRHCRGCLLALVRRCARPQAGIGGRDTGDCGGCRLVGGTDYVVSVTLESSPVTREIPSLGPLATTQTTLLEVPFER